MKGLRVVAAAAALIVAAVPEAVTRPAAGDDACGPRDTRVAVPYAITGYWLVPRSDRCVTRRTVEAIHRIGGDTLVTFGARLAPGRDPEVDCPGCYQVGRKVRRVYTYVTSEQFGPGLLRCPGERRFQTAGRTYYQLLLGHSCTKGPVDLVLVVSDGDGLGNLMAEADGYGMKVYPGLPAAPQDPAKPWLPDPRHTSAVAAFTGRVLADYRQRFAGVKAFAGVYQSFELTVKARPAKDPTIGLYRAQHAQVAAALPGTRLLVSPYIDARRGPGFPPEQVGEGLAELAGTRAGLPMVVAVQDGRGTGKVGVYGPAEADAGVDPRVAPIVGNVTNRQAYYGSTGDYYAAAARAVPPGVELWANIEAFEPTPVPGDCGRADPLPLRGRPTKARLDRQIEAARPYVSKIISYGWDPFMTCQPGVGRPSVADDIVSRSALPR
ncbi:DUF4434 domain-containing protein [Nonomuraea sp. NPDC050536]|uniref:DUF4434 domain-containing protein n=1 Tax=Nonomuraea sp. NPDC050536 TaxID=3364366 RepID=UPI0037C57796